MSVIDMKVPVIGESISEVTIAVFLKQDGDIVKKDESICEIESDKATLEMPAEEGGKIEWIIEEGDDVEIGAVVCRIDTSFNASEAAPKAATPAKETTTSEAPATENKETYATGHPSPAASKLMAEKNLSSGDVNGTGKDGRITKADAKNTPAKSIAPKEEPKKAAPAAPAFVAPEVSRSSGFSRDTERKKMSRMRRTIAKRLKEAKNETAMLTTFNEVDLTEVMAMRKRYQERFIAKYGIKLGFMSLFSKACAKVLMEMPEVNSIMDEKELIYHDYADISIAVSTGDGLVVPVIENVESLNFAEIEYKIKELAGKARNGSLSLQEMTGGTFTITNGGIFGSMMSTPIINAPQSAILGMHNILDRPMAINGEVKIRKMMYLALSYDHRVIDGSGAVTFLTKVKNLLEDPMTLMLDL
jgi:2-oxoglutarate dehydrogenase E2 component (dihydrolipoamide succinyltransferase)